ncbi:uncharacterized protein LOC128199997 [Galleria mellonella]|uniref:Uncharacterized protein LOC128199997 n=1 Tax=Galleria mellonella TaxID=7137 RepID=A0ABM3M8D9_GALME|nr:uncharacterized protein LOC128199997 [Galleria mellonella]
MDDDGEHLNSYKQSSYQNSAPHYQRRPHEAPNHGITRPRQRQPLWTPHATNIRAPPMPGGSKNLQFGQSPTGTSNSKHHRTFRKAPQESKIHATREPTDSRNIQGQAVNATQSNSAPSGSRRPWNQNVQNNQPVQRDTNISSSGNQKRKHPLETLQEIAKSNDILAEINNKKNFFNNLFK